MFGSLNIDADEFQLDRSLPDLGLVQESSLMSVLRWNYKANIVKTVTSDNCQIAMVFQSILH